MDFVGRIKGVHYQMAGADQAFRGRLSKKWKERTIYLDYSNERRIGETSFRQNSGV